MNKEPNHKIHGYCKRCEAPVFLNSTDDQYGNTVSTLNCWNGHYAWINIEGIEPSLPVENKIRASTSLVERISFFNLS